MINNSSRCSYSKENLRITHYRITTMVNSNEGMKDIMKIVKSLENSGLLLKDVSQTSQNKAQEQKSGFLSMLLGKVGASLLGNLLAEKR